MTPAAYRIADLTLDTGRRSVERGGTALELGRLTYALLLALVESAPNVVTHEELVQRVWGGRLTSPEAVTQRVKLLRDALQDDAEQPRYVGRVRGQGYRLIPSVEKLSGPGAPSQSSRSDKAALSPDGPAVRTPSPWFRARLAIIAGTVAAGVVAAAYFALPRLAAPSAEPGVARSLDFEITELTAMGRALTPAISPDGKYVVYAQLDDTGTPRSLWVKQTAASGAVEVVASDGESIVVAPSMSPDGNFIDYIKAVGGGWEVWRVPLLGGAAHRVRGATSTPIGWSADGRSQAFVQYDAFGNTFLVTVNDRAEERVLASRAVPIYFVSLNIVGQPPAKPAWSPNGRLIAIPELVDVLTHRITFVDTVTGAETSLDSQGSFVPQGVAWLGPSTLVLSQPEVLGRPVQLWRMTYPGGTISRLTNDVASYLGVDLDASRTRLVTTRRETRTSVWLGDAVGGNAMQVVPPTLFSGTNVFLAWAGDRLLYDATLNGRSGIVGIAPGNAAPVEVVADAFHVAASPDGGTMVFSSAVRGREGLWKMDAPGAEPVQLAGGFVVEPVVTADRKVVFVSNKNGVQSPWIVPLDGGDAVEVVGEFVGGVTVSPDGSRIAFPSMLLDRPVLVVCDLPRCSNRVEAPVPANYAGSLVWTPDGSELAYLARPGREIWAVPVEGGEPHAVTSLGPAAGLLARFAWSRDGSRLAFVRIAYEFDVVMISGLRP